MGMSPSMRQRVTDYIGQLQETVVAELEGYGSGKKFRRESWSRDEGGGGVSYTFAGPDHPIEKAGVNVSTITGILPPAAVKQMSSRHAALEHIDDSLPFSATGLSLILHPRHPRVPAAHANYRYFQVLSSQTGAVLAAWFGVITDLTPAYVDEPDFRHFHRTLMAACDVWSGPTASVYPAFKASCDDYLFIPHRHEHRGIGGVRFDDMDPDAMCALLAPQPGVSEETVARLSAPDAIFSLVRALGDSFLPSFIDIMERHMHQPIVPRERRWQLLRRGRAVEFNLVVDRGTKFGLAVPGVLAENVLVGMPPEARWEYCSELGTEGQDTPEAEMIKVLKRSRNWVD